jgi:hypothetical protein
METLHVPGALESGRRGLAIVCDEELPLNGSRRDGAIAVCGPTYSHAGNAIT